MARVGSDSDSPSLPDVQGHPRTAHPRHSGVVVSAVAVEDCEAVVDSEPQHLAQVAGGTLGKVQGPAGGEGLVHIDSWKSHRF